MSEKLKGDGALIERYIAIRDRKKEMKARHDEELAPYNEALEKIEAHFLKHFNESDTDSVAVRDVGTAFRQTRTSAKVDDWDAFFKFVQENEAWEMLEKRATKGAVEAYKDEHQDLPPGIGWSEVLTVNIRRS